VTPDFEEGRVYNDRVAQKVLTVCINVRKPPFASCGARGALPLLEDLKKQIADRGLPVEVQTIACLGKCDIGPNARLSPGNHWFNRIGSAEDILKKLEEIHAA
jgi:NADH:ubiquinone oxidoreductase subunit E